MAERALIQAPGSFGTSARAATGEQLGKILVDGLGATTGAMGKAQAQQDALDKENSFIAKSDLVLQRKQFQNQHGYVNLSSDERRKVDKIFYNDPDTLSKLKVLQEDDKNSFLMGQASDEEETLKIEDKEITASHTNMFTQTMTTYIDSNLSPEEFGSILDRTRMMTSKMKPVDQYKQVADIIKAKVKENPADYEKYESYLDVIKDPTLKEEALSTIKRESKVFEQSKAIQSIASGSSSVMDANAKLNTKGIDSIEVNSDMVSKVFNGNQELGIGLANENSLKIEQLTNIENKFNAAIRKEDQDNAIILVGELLKNRDYNKFSTETKAMIDVMSKLGEEGQGNHIMNMIEGAKNPIGLPKETEKDIVEEVTKKPWFNKKIDENIANTVVEVTKKIVVANPDIDTDDAVESALAVINKDTLTFNDRSFLIKGVSQSDINAYTKSINNGAVVRDNPNKEIVNISSSQDGKVSVHTRDGGWTSYASPEQFKKEMSQDKKSYKINRTAHEYGAGGATGKARHWLDVGVSKQSVISNKFFNNKDHKLIAGYVKYIYNLNNKKTGTYATDSESLNSYMGKQTGHKAGSKRIEDADYNLLSQLFKNSAVSVKADGDFEVHGLIDSKTTDDQSKLAISYTPSEIAKQADHTEISNISTIRDDLSVNHNLNISMSDISKYSINKLDNKSEEYTTLMGYVADQSGDSDSERLKSAYDTLRKKLKTSVKLRYGQNMSENITAAWLSEGLSDKNSEIHEVIMWILEGKTLEKDSTWEQ